MATGSMSSNDSECLDRGPYAFRSARHLISSASSSGCEVRSSRVFIVAASSGDDDGGGGDDDDDDGGGGGDDDDDDDDDAEQSGSIVPSSTTIGEGWISPSSF